jgi:hypothetical protein
MLTTKAEITAEESDFTRILWFWERPRMHINRLLGTFRVNLLSTK